MLTNAHLSHTTPSVENEESSVKHKVRLKQYLFLCSFHCRITYAFGPGLHEVVALKRGAVPNPGLRADERILELATFPNTSRCL